MSKVAVGCGEVEELRARLSARAEAGEVSIVTRYRPTRAGELIGGSLYWIIRHQLVCRQRILRFEETEEGRCRIWLDATVVPVRARPKRAHQGWRYLTAEQAPGDFAGGDEDLAALPAGLTRELSMLGLI